MNTHKWTDSQLRKLEKQIKTAYTVAYGNVKAEMLKLKAEIDELAKTPQERLLLWQKRKRLDELAKTMTDGVVGGTLTALALLNKASKTVYSTVYNDTAESLSLKELTARGVERALQNQANPFNEISIDGLKDKSVLERKIKSALLSSILSGESQNEMAKRIKAVTESEMKDTIRLTRTQITQVENGARQTLGDYAKDEGLTVYKRWVTQGDDRVRDKHASADGQEVPIDEPFEVGGELLMYPADTSLGASADNVINCRCYVEIFTK